MPDFNHERQSVNKQLIKGHYSGLKLTELELFPDGQLDTTMVADSRYNADGRLTEVLSYTFNKYEEIKDLEYWQKLSRYQQGMRVRLTYDNSGNVVSRRNTLISPRNSYLALVNQQLRTGNNRNASNFNPDSLLAAGVPEHLNEQEFITTRYNKDNNATEAFDSVNKTTTNYRYVYDKEKRVVQQRVTSWKLENPREKTVTIYQLNYDHMGNLDTITAYRSFMDTVNVIAPRNRQYMVGRVFNDKGKAISEYTTGQGVDATYTLLAYQDTLNTGSIVLKPWEANDTGAIVQIDYDEKKRASAERTITFYRGKRYAFSRKEFTYDAYGNVVEIRYFKRPAEATKEVMEKKDLLVMY